MVHTINGTTIAAQVGAKNTETRRPPTAAQIAFIHETGTRSHSRVGNQDPGAAKVTPVQSAPAAAVATDAARKTSGLDSGAQLLKQFEQGLQHLAGRAETQVFKARYGAGADSAGAARAAAELTGKSDQQINRSGRLDSREQDKAADTNMDGKVSEEERQRYQMPITYRNRQRAVASLLDSPSAFSLTEAHRAYGVVTQEAGA